MSRWFRHYAGFVRDDKLVRVAIRSKQTVERVCWIYAAILESAAEIDDAGRYDFDAAEASYFLRAEEADVEAVIRELETAGRLSDGTVTKWANRQFQSDKSAARVAKHRERKRENNANSDSGNADVTLQEQRCIAPETETETEKKGLPIGSLVVSEPESDDKPTLKPEHVVEVWNATAQRLGLPLVKKLTPERRQRVMARIRENSLEDFHAALSTIDRSPFLRGDNKSGWRADFDFFCQKGSFTKLTEGVYER
jgi:hypothetical protein